ncbi:MAG: ATP-dependent Clp protease adaptor ClpS [Bacteroidetes bacterium]|nr:ATP-dependent Clp protease adaptor ClpS [Bacteroidota bacterium]
MVKHKVKPVGRTEGLTGDLNALILFNDDVNTFEFVIESLVEVCNHDFEQAEQCALITHFKGKCTIKSGGADDLRIMAEELTRRGLTVAVD